MPHTGVASLETVIAKGLIATVRRRIASARRANRHHLTPLGVEPVVTDARSDRYPGWSTGRTEIGGIGMTQQTRGADLRGRRVTLGQLLGEVAKPPGRSARTVEPSSLPLVRLGLAVACMALIVFGVGVSVGGVPVSDGQVSPASVSTPAAAPIRPLKPNPRPYSRPAWADPSGDTLSYLPEGSGPGWFPAPAVEPAPDDLSGSAPLLTPPGRR